MIAEGRYRARAQHAELGVGGSGTHYVKVAFELVEAHDIVVWRGFLSAKAAPEALRSLYLCGWAGDLADLSGVGRNQVEVVVRHEPDRDGSLQPYVRWINPIGGGIPISHRMTPEQIRELASSLRAGPSTGGRE
jgi:hypothetical protein